MWMHMLSHDSEAGVSCLKFGYRIIEAESISWLSSWASIKHFLVVGQYHFAWLDLFLASPLEGYILPAAILWHPWIVKVMMSVTFFDLIMRFSLLNLKDKSVASESTERMKSLRICSSFKGKIYSEKIKNQMFKSDLCFHREKTGVFCDGLCPMSL